MTIKLNSRLAQPSDYPELLVLWEESVKASHHFLAADERAAIKAELPHYFQAVQLVIWYETPEDWIAFSGVSNEGEELEMLFVAPRYFRQGYGQKIIGQLLAQGLKKVDVNAENPAAQKFYEAQGFNIIGKSATDGQGRAHPLVHLAYHTKKE